MVKRIIKNLAAALLLALAFAGGVQLQHSLERPAQSTTQGGTRLITSPGGGGGGGNGSNEPATVTPTPTP